MYLMQAGSKNPAGGFAFGSFMSSDPWVALNKAVPDSVTPSRKSNANNADVEKAAPWIPMAREIIADAWPVPSMPAVGGYETKLNDAINRVLWEDVNPKQALDDAVQATQIDVDKALKQG
jgi:maltose-binding protein MalE